MNRPDHLSNMRLSAVGQRVAPNQLIVALRICPGLPLMVKEREPFLQVQLTWPVPIVIVYCDYRVAEDLKFRSFNYLGFVEGLVLGHKIESLHGHGLDLLLSLLVEILNLLNIKPHAISLTSNEYLMFSKSKAAWIPMISCLCSPIIAFNALNL